MNIELTVQQCPDGYHYMACWPDGELLFSHVPEVWLDLMPFLIARRLNELGYNLERLLVVRLRGADCEMVRAPLGAVAATPLVNTTKPVKYPQHRPFKGEALR